ncbi:MAG: hypothetical protein RLZ10_2327 [Bacteroidota bacterium]|jgi:hypothetical protein
MLREQFVDYRLTLKLTNLKINRILASEFSEASSYMQNIFFQIIDLLDYKQNLRSESLNRTNFKF